MTPIQRGAAGKPDQPRSPPSSARAGGTSACVVSTGSHATKLKRVSWPLSPPRASLARTASPGRCERARAIETGSGATASSRITSAHYHTPHERHAGIDARASREVYSCEVMPVLRNPLKATPQPQDGETERKAASGTRQVQRSPSYHDEHSMPTAIRDIFPPEEIPTGKLGGTQLRKLVARTQPEADTMPAFELVPVPAARSKPIPEPERSGRREVFFARRTAFAQHE